MGRFYSLSAFLAVPKAETCLRKHPSAVFMSDRTSNMQLQTQNTVCQNFKLGRRCRRRENVGFITAHCTNECLQLIPLRFLETILSHVEFLFGAICHGKRDRIYYLLHSIIAGPGVLLRWERSQKSLFWRGNSLCTSCPDPRFRVKSSVNVHRPSKLIFTPLFWSPWKTYKGMFLGLEQKCQGMPN